MTCHETRRARRMPWSPRVVWIAFARQEAGVACGVAIPSACISMTSTVVMPSPVSRNTALVTGVIELLKLDLELATFSCPREVAALPEYHLAEPCRLNVPSSEMARPATVQVLDVRRGQRVY